MDHNLPDGSQHFIIFKTEDNNVAVDVLFQGKTVWLTFDQMAKLFDRNKSTISRHIKNIFEEGELERNSIVANFATTASNCKTYQVDYRGIKNNFRFSESFCPGVSMRRASSDESFRCSCGL